jgi:hypothetical protein
MAQRYDKDNSFWSVFMPAVVRFRVVSAFEVIQPCIACIDGPPFVLVPAGAIIETDEEIRSPGIAEIRWNNQALLARMRDIEECAKPLDEPACA